MTGAVALFLDRDGVINVDNGHVGSQERWTFMPEIFELCQAARARDLKIIVATNQAGIARGYYSEQDFLNLTDWMTAQFAERGVTIDGVYYCPFHPTEGRGKYRAASDDRKPGPGMLQRAAREHGLDLARSAFLGDNETDMQAGRAAGVGRLILLSTKNDTSSTIADVVIGQLLEAIPLLPDGRP